jgi:SAM-dependent methyltransferase
MSFPAVPVVPAFEANEAQAFAERLCGILDAGALALMLSIGHRAGLFDAMQRLGLAGSEEIADEAGLHERYVREWLGAMTTGGIVAYQPSTRRYQLPPEHAASLTRAARPHNLAATAQWIPLLARVEDDVLACFERGGGVPAATYERFGQVLAEERDQRILAALDDAILPLVPGLREALARGRDVLDVGCGSGRVVHALARRFPWSRFTGYDLGAGAIAEARRSAAELGLRNVQFEVRDVADLEVRAGFDWIVSFDALHDRARPDAVLRAIARALRRDGVFLMRDGRGSSRVELDAGRPLASFQYAASCLHSIAVSLAAGGSGLGAMAGAETAGRLLAEAGFGALEVRALPGDRFDQYYVARLAG